MQRLGSASFLICQSSLSTTWCSDSCLQVCPEPLQPVVPGAVGSAAPGTARSSSQATWPFARGLKKPSPSGLAEAPLQLRGDNFTHH